jgi:hypothetical protein
MVSAGQVHEPSSVSWTLSWAFFACPTTAWRSRRSLGSFGHTSSHVTETVYRQELWPVLQDGTEVMDRLFGSVNSGPS